MPSTAMLCRFCLAVLLSLSVAADEDPFEPLNRKIYAFNDAVDRAVLKPVATGYNRTVPGILRQGVGNFFQNLKMPVVIVNQVLQLKPDEAANDTARLVVNTALGFGGLFDVASRMDLDLNDEDFGQTLGRWGVPPGPYLVVPFWGASTLRDSVGSAAGGFWSPIRLVDDDVARYTLWLLWAVDARAKVLAAESFVSGDRYLFLRDAYLQRREFLVNDGVVDEDPFLDDF